MSVHFSKMNEAQRLEWLLTYERQNPKKYLQKYGKVTGRFPSGHPEAGQPCAWEYVSPQEALKTISPSFPVGNVLGVKVEVQENPDVKVAQEFIQPVVAEPVSTKRGRKNV